MNCDVGNKKEAIMTNETRKFIPPNEGEVREYVTRDGQESRVVLHGNMLFGVVGAEPEGWSLRGDSLFGTARHLDLFDKPKTLELTMWVAIRGNGEFVTSSLRPHFVDDSTASLTKHTITITEGQFDED